MALYRIGIDPGCSGAAVVLKDGQPDAWLNMPLIKVGTNTRVNGAALASFLRPFPGAPVFLELVHIMPKQGASSAFTFGLSSAATSPPRSVAASEVVKSMGIVGLSGYRLARGRPSATMPMMSR